MRGLFIYIRIGHEKYTSESSWRLSENAAFPASIIQAKARDADVLVGITRSIPIVFADFTVWYVTFVFLQEITIYANSFY